MATDPMSSPGSHLVLDEGAETGSEDMQVGIGTPVAWSPAGESVHARELTRTEREGPNYQPIEGSEGNQEGEDVEGGKPFHHLDAEDQGEHTDEPHQQAAEGLGHGQEREESNESDADYADERREYHEEVHEGRADDQGNDQEDGSDDDNLGIREGADNEPIGTNQPEQSEAALEAEIDEINSMLRRIAEGNTDEGSQSEWRREQARQAKREAKKRKAYARKVIRTAKQQAKRREMVKMGKQGHLNAPRKQPSSPSSRKRNNATERQFAQRGEAKEMATSPTPPTHLEKRMAPHLDVESRFIRATREDNQGDSGEEGTKVSSLEDTTFVANGNEAKNEEEGEGGFLGNAEGEAVEDSPSFRMHSEVESQSTGSNEDEEDKQAKANESEPVEGEEADDEKTVGDGSDKEGNFVPSRIEGEGVPEDASSTLSRRGPKGDEDRRTSLSEFEEIWRQHQSGRESYNQRREQTPSPGDPSPPLAEQSNQSSFARPSAVPKLNTDVPQRGAGTASGHQGASTLTKPPTNPRSDNPAGKTATQHSHTPARGGERRNNGGRAYKQKKSILQTLCPCLK